MQIKNPFTNTLYLKVFLGVMVLVIGVGAVMMYLHMSTTGTDGKKSLSLYQRAQLRADIRGFVKNGYGVDIDTSFFAAANTIFCHKGLASSTQFAGVEVDCAGRKQNTVFALGHAASSTKTGNTEEYLFDYLKKNTVVQNSTSTTFSCVVDTTYVASSSQVLLCSAYSVKGTSKKPEVSSKGTFSILYFNVTSLDTNFLMISPAQDASVFKKMMASKKMLPLSSFFVERAYAQMDGAGDSYSEDSSSASTGSTGTTSSTSGFGGLMDALSSLVSGIANAIGNAIGGIADALGGAFGGTTGGFSSAAQATSIAGMGFAGPNGSLSGYSHTVGSMLDVPSGAISVGPNSYCCNINGDSYSVGTQSDSSGSDSAGVAYSAGMPSRADGTCPVGDVLTSGPIGKLCKYEKGISWWAPYQPAYVYVRPNMSCPATAVGYSLSSGENDPGGYPMQISLSDQVITNANVCARPCWNGVTVYPHLGETCPLQPTGDLSVSSPTCSIATGASSCTVNGTWTTANVSGTSVITSDKPIGTLYSSNGESSRPFTVYGPPTTSNTTFTLSNSGITLDQESVSASCGVGGWDSLGGECSDPRVTSNVITGQYYSSPGTSTFTCSGADRYELRRDPAGTNTLIRSGMYTGAVTANVLSVTDSYAITCLHGDYAGPKNVFSYSTPPPPPAVISLIATPRSIAKGASATLVWDTQFPVPSCTLTAKAVCTNNACSVAQLASETELNQKLATEKTDASDPYTSRLISTAVQNVAPGHIDTDWKAFGRKTLSISATTDFTYTCGQQKVTARVLVTKSREE